MNAGARPVGSIGEIPFAAIPPLALLNLEEDRDRPDDDYAGFGHCRIARLWLDDDDGARLVTAALVLALHGADDGRRCADDVELEFRIAGAAGVVTAMLSAFLARKLAAVRGAEEAIVLAMCNPHAAAIPPPVGAGATPLWYALGDVESWLDPATDEVHLRAAGGWRRAAGEGADEVGR